MEFRTTQNSKLDVRRLHVQPDCQRSGPQKIASPQTTGPGNPFRDRPQACFDDKRAFWGVAALEARADRQDVNESDVGAARLTRPNSVRGQCPPSSSRSVTLRPSRCKRKVTCVSSLISGEGYLRSSALSFAFPSRGGDHPDRHPPHSAPSDHNSPPRFLLRTTGLFPRVVRATGDAAKGACHEADRERWMGCRPVHLPVPPQCTCAQQPVIKNKKQRSEKH